MHLKNNFKTEIMSTKTKWIIGIIAVVAVAGTVTYVGYTKGWWLNKKPATT